MADRALQIGQFFLGLKHGGLSSNGLQRQPVQPRISDSFPGSGDDRCITQSDAVAAGIHCKPLITVTLAQCYIAQTFDHGDIRVI